jgi:hypothetical protein
MKLLILISSCSRLSNYFSEPCELLTLLKRVPAPCCDSLLLGLGSGLLAWLGWSWSSDLGSGLGSGLASGLASGLGMDVGL